MLIWQIEYILDVLPGLIVQQISDETSADGPSPMMTSSNGNIFRVTGHLCGEFTGHRWIPLTKTSDAEEEFSRYFRFSSRYGKSISKYSEQDRRWLQLRPRLRLTFGVWFPQKTYIWGGAFWNTHQPISQWYTLQFHDNVIKWKHFSRYWPFVRGIHRSPGNSPHKDQWRGALMFSLICAWINGWVNNREAGDSDSDSEVFISL